MTQISLRCQDYCNSGTLQYRSFVVTGTMQQNQNGAASKHQPEIISTGKFSARSMCTLGESDNSGVHPVNP